MILRQPRAFRSRFPGVTLLGLGLLLGLPSLASAADSTLHESGSTLLYPLFQLWIPAFEAAHPGMTITSQATDSGAGMDQAIAGRVQIGASDAYMSDELAAHNPRVLNIPLAISAVTVNYNLPNLNGVPLKLDGPTLVGIYSGKVKSWDAPQIAALNPGIKLPSQGIIPVRRADASGDTFVFTQFLDFSSQDWENAVGYGTTVAWPGVSAGRTADGNAGILQVLTTTPYAIGYIGVSFHNDVAKAGLGTARLRNQAGQDLLPTTETVSAAASNLDQRTPADERLSLVFAPGENSYPLINYEYAVVSTRQADPQTAAAIRRFLLWAIAVDGGNSRKYLDAVGFIPLPDFIRALSEKQINRIQ